MTWCQLGWRYDSLQISWQVHHHWTWPGREGKVTPVMCYTDYDEAELFVNGKSQGRRHKTGRMSASATAGKLVEKMGKEVTDSLLSRYRLVWDNVVYEPGELKVVVYDKNGHAAGEQIIRTAGTPSALQLTADKVKPPKMKLCSNMMLVLVPLFSTT